MTTQHNPHIICIEDQKDEPNPKTATTHSQPPNDPSSKPTNFNPKTFPFLASMLRKINTATPKPETIVTPPQQSIYTSTVSRIQVIKPLPMEGRQEVLEVTRVRPAQKLFQVVEDVEGLPKASILASGLKKEKEYLAEKQIEVKPKQISIVNEVNSTEVQDEFEKSKDQQLQAAESCETSIHGVNNPHEMASPIKSKVTNAAVPEEVNQSRTQDKVTNDIGSIPNAQTEKTKNISELIFQFSQKIAEYAGKGQQVSQDHMDEEKQLEVVSHFSHQVQKASSQAQESLSVMIVSPNQEEANQNGAQQQRRYEAIETNILLGCQNVNNQKSQQRVLQNQQIVLNYQQVGQLQPIQPGVEPMDIQQQINMAANSGINDLIVVHQNKAENISEPQLNINNSQLAHEILPITEQVTQQHPPPNKLPEKLVQKMNENEQNLQKNVQTLNNNIPITQNIVPPQYNLSALQMLSESELNELKNKVAKMIPDFAQKINDITNQELIEIYHMIKKELNVDLMLQTPQTSYHLAQGIQKQKQVAQVAAQQKTNHNLQKQIQNAPTLQVIQPMAMPQQTSTHMDIEKNEDVIEEESKAIKQLQQMKHLREDQLRKQISQMNPAWKEEISKMNYAELQSMLDQTLAELRKSAARKQQSQQTHPTNPSSQSQPRKPTQEETLNQNIQTITPQAAIIQAKANSIQPKASQSGQINSTQMTVQQSQNQKPVSSSMKQIRSIIISKAPDMEQKVNSLSDNRVKEIYQSHTSKAEGEENKNKQKPETIEISDTLKDKPTIQYIIKYCTQQFPQLAHDFKQLKEHQIRDIYEQLLLKIGPSISSIKSKTVVKENNSEKKAPNKDKQNKANQLSEKSAKSAEKNDHNLKRTHQTMSSTNAKKNETPKVEKKKLSPLEIRNILIAKLPQLKANIMMLDDNEIQRIFYESIQNGGNSQSNNQPTNTASIKPADPKPIQVVKPVIVLPEKKVIIDTPASKAQTIISQPKQNIQVIENTDPYRNRKMRTVILMQTEADLHEGEVVSKATMTESGFKKKCSCDCCRKLDLNELLMRLGELLQERK